MNISSMEAPTLPDTTSTDAGRFTEESCPALNKRKVVGEAWSLFFLLRRAACTMTLFISGNPSYPYDQYPGHRRNQQDLGL